MKHLIVFADGTWVDAMSDSASSAYSNIYKMNCAVDYRDEFGNIQEQFYCRGIGSNEENKLGGGVFSRGLIAQIEDMYLNICSNYELGDKIYLFGFSRGAVVARAVAGLLSYGILKWNRMQYFNILWNLFNDDPISGMSQGEKHKQLQTVAINSHLDGAAVEFLGVFDTVVGGREKTFANEIQEFVLKRNLVAPCVNTAIQILAMDETRSTFHPCIWEGQYSDHTHVEQIWLPGVHSDIGGTYDDVGLGDVALSIMVDRVLAWTTLNISSECCHHIFNEHRGLSINIHDEDPAGVWSATGMGRRIIRGHNAVVHPFADQLTNNLITYKSSARRKLYSCFEALPRSRYYASPSFADRIISL